MLVKNEKLDKNVYEIEKNQKYFRNWYFSILKVE
jgi:hypothetical protein